MGDWYEERIEPKVREIVRALRNNGINTDFACEHTMVIFAGISNAYDTIGVIDKVLRENGYKNYVLTIHRYSQAHDEEGDCLQDGEVQISLPNEKGQLFVSSLDMPIAYNGTFEVDESTPRIP